MNDNDLKKLLYYEEIIHVIKKSFEIDKSKNYIMRVY